MKLRDIYKKGCEIGYTIGKEHVDGIVREASLIPLDLEEIEKYLKNPHNVAVSGTHAIVPMEYLNNLITEVRRLRRIDEAFGGLIDSFGQVASFGQIKRTARDRLWAARCAITPNELIDRIVDSAMRHEQETYRQFPPFGEFANTLNGLTSPDGKSLSEQAWSEYRRGVENGARKAAQERMNAL